MPMLVFMEEAYPWAAVVSSYGNALGCIVPTVGEIHPTLVRGGAVLDDGTTGCSTDILPAAKLILRRSSMREPASASG
jgi:hypothetical protein